MLGLKILWKDKNEFNQLMSLSGDFFSPHFPIPNLYLDPSPPFCNWSCVNYCISRQNQYSPRLPLLFMTLIIQIQGLLDIF